MSNLKPDIQKEPVRLKYIEAKLDDVLEKLDILLTMAASKVSKYEESKS
jgi:hypothetical protein